MAGAGSLLKDLTAISKPDRVDIRAQVSGCVKQGEAFLEGVRVALAKAKNMPTSGTLKMSPSSIPKKHLLRVASTTLMA